MTLYDQKFGTLGRLPKAQPVPPPSPSVEHPTDAPAPAVAAPPGKKGTTLAYSALVAFSFLYFARPEDFIPGMANVPVGKISGGLALLGLALSWGRLKGKMPLAIKLVLVLLVHMCITVPLAFWRGGALDVVENQFSKAAIVALLIAMIVGSMVELRRLLWVQAASVAVLTVASIVVHPTAAAGGIRLWGLGGVFSNPNDFAINIAINFPLALAFIFASKGILKKLPWAIAMLFLLYGVIATYSRSGLIAMVICFFICIWEFGIKGKRPQIIAAAIFVLIVAVGVGITTPRYVARISTLFTDADIQDSGDRGSLDARKELLMESIQVTLEHPLFGVGPGNFQAYTQSWHVTHNTYTELSSETGLIGLGLFLAIVVLTFRNLGKVAKSERYKNDPQMQLFTNALRAGLAAYVVGAAFASTAYTLFPYFMVAYASVMYKIASAPEPARAQQPVGTSLNARNAKDPYGKPEEHRLAWTR